MKLFLTAFLQVFIGGGAGNTADIGGGADMNTFFQGMLIA